MESPLCGVTNLHSNIAKADDTSAEIAQIGKRQFNVTALNRTVGKLSSLRTSETIDLQVKNVERRNFSEEGSKLMQQQHDINKTVPFTTRQRMPDTTRDRLREMIENSQRRKRLSMPLKSNSTSISSNDRATESLIQNSLYKRSQSVNETNLRAQMMLTDELDKVLQLRNLRSSAESSDMNSSDLIQFPVELEPASRNSLLLQQVMQPTSLNGITTDQEVAATNLINPSSSLTLTLRNNNAVERAGSLLAASSNSLDSYLNSYSVEPENTLAINRYSQPSGTSQSNTSLKSLDDSAGDLRVLQKVVWFTSRGNPETGIVRWIGKIKDRYHAGVEFEKPVGNSSGLYNGKKLFNWSISDDPSPYSSGIPELNFTEEKHSLELPIICVICQDSLITVEEAPVQDSKAIVTSAAPKELNQKYMNKATLSTMCGHLFHAECLTQWFKLKNKVEQPCPFCQKLMNIGNTIRIFPIQGTN